MSTNVVSTPSSRSSSPNAAEFNLNFSNSIGDNGSDSTIQSLLFSPKQTVCKFYNIKFTLFFN